ncbi:MAG TPA: 30S ribosomal protein S4 [Candidatus Paceibacterota bacterium]|nr:30S ribosomal protein S4 [Candidatus Paceibacterota bacterium]
MIRESACKKCRRAGQKLFLKEERCFTAKCAMIKKPYPPGMKAKKRRSVLSEYGSQLAEKQKVKRIYGINEKQLRRYFAEALRSKGVVTDTMVNKLEMRLDNIVFRLGIAGSRTKARQIVSHGHILLNGRKVNIPSINIRKGDIIEINKSSSKKVLFKELQVKLKKYKTPLWLSSEVKENNEFKAVVLNVPERLEIEIPADLAMIVEFYSR